MLSEKYCMSSSEGPNPVYLAALAYLDAAKLIYRDESGKNGFFAIHSWFVVHHLSFIAVEVFLKSFRVTVSHSPVMDESGPEFEEFEPAYTGHHAQLESLDSGDKEALVEHLSKDQFELLMSISDRKVASTELSRGRYPYETSFPSGDEGRHLAERWLGLALALSKYSRPSTRECFTPAI